MSDNLAVMEKLDNPVLIDPIKRVDNILQDVALMRKIGMPTEESWPEFSEKIMGTLEELARGYKESHNLNLHLQERYEETLKKLRQEAKREPEKDFDDKAFNCLLGTAVKLLKSGKTQTGFNELGKIGFGPNDKDSDWNDIRDMKWDDKNLQWASIKAIEGTPLGPANTGQYLLPDPLERQLLRDAMVRSRMGELITIRQMTDGKMSFPNDDTYFNAKWRDPNYTGIIKEAAQTMGARTVLEAFELALKTYYLDSFSDDAVGDLGESIRIAFRNMWARQIDVQSMVADGSDPETLPFTGLLHAAGTVHVMQDSNIYGISSADFTEAMAKVREEEKDNAMWFMNETVLHIARTLKDDRGNPIYFPPDGAGAVGRIYGYPTWVVSVMPSATSVGPDQRVIFFGDARRMTRGIRKGIEISIFSQTQQALDYGNIALRQRLREGYKAFRVDPNQDGGTCVAIATKGVA
jgi:HK97 family phage major capsid protein